MSTSMYKVRGVVKLAVIMTVLASVIIVSMTVRAEDQGDAMRFLEVSTQLNGYSVSYDDISVSNQLDLQYYSSSRVDISIVDSRLGGLAYYDIEQGNAKLKYEKDDGHSILSASIPLSNLFAAAMYGGSLLSSDSGKVGEKFAESVEKGHESGSAAVPLIDRISVVFRFSSSSWTGAVLPGAGSLDLTSLMNKYKWSDIDKRFDVSGQLADSVMSVFYEINSSRVTEGESERLNESIKNYITSDSDVKEKFEEYFCDIARQQVSGQVESCKLVSISFDEDSIDQLVNSMGITVDRLKQAYSIMSERLQTSLSNAASNLEADSIVGAGVIAGFDLGYELDISVEDTGSVVKHEDIGSGYQGAYILLDPRNDAVLNRRYTGIYEDKLAVFSELSNYFPEGEKKLYNDVILGDNGLIDIVVRDKVCGAIESGNNGMAFLSDIPLPSDVGACRDGMPHYVKDLIRSHGFVGDYKKHIRLIVANILKGNSANSVSLAEPDKFSSLLVNSVKCSVQSNGEKLPSEVAVECSVNFNEEVKNNFDLIEVASSEGGIERARAVVGIAFPLMPSPAVQYNYSFDTTKGFSSSYKVPVRVGISSASGYVHVKEAVVRVRVNEGNGTTTRTIKMSGYVRLSLDYSLAGNASASLMKQSVTRAEMVKRVASSIEIVKDTTELKVKTEYDLSSLDSGAYLLIAGPSPLAGSGLLDKLSGTMYYVGNLFGVQGIVDVSNNIVNAERSLARTPLALLDRLGFPLYVPIPLIMESSIDALDWSHEAYMLPGEYLGVLYIRGKMYDLGPYSDVLNYLPIVATVALEKVTLECKGSCVGKIDARTLEVRKDSNSYSVLNVVVGAGPITEVGLSVYAVPYRYTIDVDHGATVDSSNGFIKLVNGVLGVAGRLIGVDDLSLDNMQIQGLSYITLEPSDSSGGKNGNSGGFKIGLVDKLTYIMLNNGRNEYRFILGDSGDATIEVRRDGIIIVMVALINGIPVPLIFTDIGQANGGGKVLASATVHIIENVEVVPVATLYDSSSGMYHIYAMAVGWTGGNCENGGDLHGLLLLRGPYRPFDTGALNGYSIALLRNRQVYGRPVVLSDLGVAIGSIDVKLDELEPGRYSLSLISTSGAAVNVCGRYNYLVFERPRLYSIRYQVSDDTTRLLLYYGRPAETSYFDNVHRQVDETLRSVLHAMLGDLAGDLSELEKYGRYGDELGANGNINDISSELVNSGVKQLIADKVDGYLKSIAEDTINNIVDVITRQLIAELASNVAGMVAAGVLPPPAGGLASAALNHIIEDINHYVEDKVSDGLDKVTGGLVDQFGMGYERAKASSDPLKMMLGYFIKQTMDYAVSQIENRFDEVIDKLLNQAVDQGTGLLPEDLRLIAQTIIRAKARPVLFWAVFDEEGNVGQVLYPRIPLRGFSNIVVVAGNVEFNGEVGRVTVYPLPAVTTMAGVILDSTVSLLSGGTLFKVAKSLNGFTNPLVTWHASGMLVTAAGVLKTAENIVGPNDNVEVLIGGLLDAAKKVDEIVAGIEDTSKLGLGIYDLGHRVGMPSTVDVVVYKG